MKTRWKRGLYCSCCCYGFNIIITLNTTTLNQRPCHLCTRKLIQDCSRWEVSKPAPLGFRQVVSRFRVQGAGVRVLDTTPIREVQMEKNMEDKMNSRTMVVLVELKAQGC